MSTNVLILVLIISKPLASQQEVCGLERASVVCSVLSDNKNSLGKAPRKQLATKAARKTAAVSCWPYAPNFAVETADRGRVTHYIFVIAGYWWCQEAASFQARYRRSSRNSSLPEIYGAIDQEAAFPEARS